MQGSNCCFLTHIWASQEAGQVVWYSHLSKNFPQFVVIHTAKGFYVVHEAKVDAFLEYLYTFDTYCLKRVSNPTSRDKEPTRKHANFLIQQDTINHRGGSRWPESVTEGQREGEGQGRAAVWRGSPCRPQLRTQQCRFVKKWLKVEGKVTGRMRDNRGLCPHKTGNNACSEWPDWTSSWSSRHGVEYSEDFAAGNY